MTAGRSMARGLAATGVAVPILEIFLSPFIQYRRTQNPGFCKPFTGLPGIVWCLSLLIASLSKWELNRPLTLAFASVRAQSSVLDLPQWAPNEALINPLAGLLQVFEWH